MLSTQTSAQTKSSGGQAQTAGSGQQEAKATVARLMGRARAAQREFEKYTQEQVDDVVAAVAWACYKQENAELLARRAVEDTGLGRYEDKVAKNRRKTMGTLRDLTGARSVGVLSEDAATGITEIAKPMGVVAAITPSTNPSATPTNKAMMILKGRNAVILAPSPKGAGVCALLLELMHKELRKLGAPLDLVQHLPLPVTKELTHELMRQADFVVATGSQSNVRAAYSSGTPAIGVGAGNVPVIIDETADVEAATEKIKRSKIFDYATSCSSENSVLLHTALYDRAIAAFKSRGGHLLDPAQKAKLQRALWIDGKLNQKMVAQSPAVLAELSGLDDPAARRAEFFLVEEDGIGPAHPFSGEKLCVVLTVYRFSTFDEAVAKTQAILDHMGAGHSVGIHSEDEDHIQKLAHAVRAARIIVNQSHAFATGGSFENGMGFTLTMGAGTWAKNSISENLSYRHFLNITRLVRAIPPRVPTEEQLWGKYLARYGA